MGWREYGGNEGWNEGNMRNGNGNAGNQGGNEENVGNQGGNGVGVWGIKVEM